MWSTESPETSTTEDWARGFDRYLDGKDKAIPLDVVREARKEYLDLCASQRDRRLLHGDLHHGNVLFDADRGWLAIDPKGVLGETEFEIGAVLLNPIAHPELFASQECARRRVTTFEKALKLDGKRILRWAFARAVLSAIWTMEDGDSSDNMHSALMLAREIQRMV
jgi:streptomycin 6-kinase